VDLTLILNEYDFEAPAESVKVTWTGYSPTCSSNDGLIEYVRESVSKEMKEGRSSLFDKKVCTSISCPSSSLIDGSFIYYGSETVTFIDDNELFRK
jgi:hypothetical protein